MINMQTRSVREAHVAKGTRRKIEIEFIQDKVKRHVTFSKRKAGIMKKVGNFRCIFALIYTFLFHAHTKVHVISRLSNLIFMSQYMYPTDWSGLWAQHLDWHTTPHADCLGEWPRVLLCNTKTEALHRQRRRFRFLFYHHGCSTESNAWTLTHG